MKLLITKYAGECRKCGKALAVGVQVVYERHVGIFCPECMPKDPEEVRKYRQEAVDRKAAKLEEWAEKREQKASATLGSTDRIMSDIAFITQPGHVPGRQRIIDQRDKAFGSLNKANEFRDRANWIRNQGVRVKGDAVRRDEEQRAEVRKWIRPGMLVDTCHCGILKVLKVNKKTATIEGRFGNFTHDLIYLKKVKGE